MAPLGCCFRRPIEAGQASPLSFGVTVTASSLGSSHSRIPRLASISAAMDQSSGGRAAESSSGQSPSVAQFGFHPPMLDDFVELSDPVPGIPHIYLPSSLFSSNSLGIELDKSVNASLRYQSGFQDRLVVGIAAAIVSELRTQTSAGRLLVETLAWGSRRRLLQNHVSPSPVRAFRRITQGGLDQRRLSRVLEYINANLEGGLTIDHLASITCLSRFHFARALQSCHRSVSSIVTSVRSVSIARKYYWHKKDRSLVDIALALSFSSQANFTRAFRQMTGQTPGQFRRRSD